MVSTLVIKQKWHLNIPYANYCFLKAFDKCQCSAENCFVLPFQAALPTQIRAALVHVFPFISVRWAMLICKWAHSFLLAVLPKQSFPVLPSRILPLLLLTVTCGAGREHPELLRRYLTHTHTHHVAQQHFQHSLLTSCWAPGFSLTRETWSAESFWAGNTHLQQRVELSFLSLPVQSKPWKEQARLGVWQQGAGLWGEGAAAGQGRVWAQEEETRCSGAGADCKGVRRGEAEGGAGREGQQASGKALQVLKSWKTGKELRVVTMCRNVADVGGDLSKGCQKWWCASGGESWTAVTSILNVLGCGRVPVALKDVPSILESKSCRELCTSSWNTGFWLGCGIE